ncbi:hypothetical protein, partial [Caballeronia catudaia]|uniref:hypothetical protein n=1 Tax=Caballeronia catudaia TaxID=1777136 RepID=UPI00135C2DAE
LARDELHRLTSNSTRRRTYSSARHNSPSLEDEIFGYIPLPDSAAGPNPSWQRDKGRLAALFCPLSAVADSRKRNRVIRRTVQNDFRFARAAAALPQIPTLQPDANEAAARPGRHLIAFFTVAVSDSFISFEHHSLLAWAILVDYREPASPEWSTSR